MMMKIMLLTCALMAAAVLARPQDEEQLFESFDVQELLDNGRLLKAYVTCLLDKGPCTQEGSAIKKNLPEYLSTSCAKCNAKHRATARAIINAIQGKFPDLWEELLQKEDPAKEHRESFNKFLSSTD